MTHFADPFICKLSGCGKAFTNRSSLRHHVALHYGKEIYVCHGCPNRKWQCKTLQQLEKHFKLNHCSEPLKYGVRRKGHLTLPGLSDTSEKILLPTPTQPTSCTERKNNETNIKVENCSNYTKSIRVDLESVHFNDHIKKETPDTTDHSHNDSYKSVNVETGNDQDIGNDLDSEELKDEVGNVSLPTLLEDPAIKRIIKENPYLGKLLAPTNRRYQKFERHKDNFTCKLCYWSCKRHHDFMVSVKKQIIIFLSNFEMKLYKV